jgi:putative membrane protein
VAWFVLRLAIGAFGLWLAARIVPGMHIEGTGTLIAAAFLLGVVNALLRPVLVLLTLPLTILTLGLFLLVVNAAMLGVVAALLEDFTLSGFGAALLGSLVVSAVGWFFQWQGGAGTQAQITIIERRD